MVKERLVAFFDAVLAIIMTILVLELEKPSEISLKGFLALKENFFAKKYDQTLHDKPRWLVLNKLDMIAPEERAARVADFVKRLGWEEPVHEISALTREGCQALVHAIYEHVHQAQRMEVETPPVDPRFAPASAEPASE